MLIKNPKIRLAIYAILVVVFLVPLVLGLVTEEQIKALPAQVGMVAGVVGFVMAALNVDPKSDT